VVEEVEVEEEEEADRRYGSSAVIIHVHELERDKGREQGGGMFGTVGRSIVHLWVEPASAARTRWHRHWRSEWHGPTIDLALEGLDKLRAL